MNCPNCNRTKTKSHPVDERYQFTCLDCNNRWYSNRKLTNSQYTILDEVADEVAKKGKAKTHIVAITNFCFSKPHTGIKDWCLSHGFSYSKSDDYYHFQWAANSPEGVIH